MVLQHEIQYTYTTLTMVLEHGAGTLTMVLEQLTFLNNCEGLSLGHLNNGCVGLLQEVEDGDETIGGSEEQEAERDHHGLWEAQDQ